MQAPSPLTPRERERAMSLSVADGVFYALMVGCGETYFLANAVRLGASRLLQGLVVTLPLFTGAAGSVLALVALARARRRKGLVVGAAVGEIATLLSIVALDAAGRLTPGLLVAAACVYQALAQAAGTAWSSWYGDLVPKGIRGAYFARRNRFVHLSTCAGLVGAGLLLQALEPGAAGEVAAGAGGAGYRLVFSLAAGFRAVSSLLLALSPEPPFRGLSDARQTFRFLATSRGSRAWRLLGTGAGLQLCVYLASPYFGPFMLQDLEFTYLEYMVSSVTVVTFKFAMLPAWGRLVDRHGSRPVYTLAAVLVAVVPLPWLWARGLAWVMAGQALSGFSWAGYEVSYFSHMLESSTKRTRPWVFAAQNVLNGTAQLLGGLGGAAILVLAGPDFRVVFAASLGARLLVAVLVPRLVPRAPGGEPIGRRALLLRVVGFRAHGGLVHRPIGDGAAPSSGTPPDGPAEGPRF